LELRQTARGRHTLGHIRFERGQTRLPRIDVGLHLRDVKFPEAKHRETRDDDKCADLGVPRKFAQ